MRTMPTALVEALDEAVLEIVCRKTLLSATKAMVDVAEETGNNDGHFIELLQQVVDGKAQNESYCVAFVMGMVGYTEYRLNIKSHLNSTEGVLYLWNSTPEEYKKTSPIIGDIAMWRHKDTVKGHCGIVISINDDGSFGCVEGNTKSGAQGFDTGNEGQGIFLKERPPGTVGTMELLGFISPF